MNLIINKIIITPKELLLIQGSNFSRILPMNTPIYVKPQELILINENYFDIEYLQTHKDNT